MWRNRLGFDAIIIGTAVLSALYLRLRHNLGVALPLVEAIAVVALRLGVSAASAVLAHSALLSQSSSPIG